MLAPLFPDALDSFRDEYKKFRIECANEAHHSSKEGIRPRTTSTTTSAISDIKSNHTNDGVSTTNHKSWSNITARSNDVGYGLETAVFCRNMYIGQTWMRSRYANTWNANVGLMNPLQSTGYELCSWTRGVPELAKHFTPDQMNMSQWVYDWVSCIRCWVAPFSLRVIYFIFSAHFHPECAQFFTCLVPKFCLCQQKSDQKRRRSHRKGITFFKVKDIPITSEMMKFTKPLIRLIAHRYSYQTTCEHKLKLNWLISPKFTRAAGNVVNFL